MTIVDTSACIEFLRGTASAVSSNVRWLIRDRSIRLTEPVLMELLAGRSAEPELRSIRRFAAGAKLVPVGGIETWEDAAAIYRLCAAAGHTVRSQLDCLIAAVAIREDVPVLHADRDFDAIAEHTPLRVVPLG